MIDWVHYRKEFPVTDNQAYFMTAGAGPVSKSVLSAIYERYGKLAQHGGNIFQSNIEMVEECRAEMAKLINADVEDIAFIPSVSFAMNALSLSLINKSAILMPDVEFPSASIPWLNTGYDIDFVEPGDDLRTNLKNKLLKKNYLFIASLIQYSNGYNLDLPELLEAIAAHSSATIINATQCIGAYPVDVKAWDVDVLVGACHKWMFCGEGIAFLYIKKEFFKKLKPALAGWRSSPYSMGMSLKENRFYHSARVFELGWPNMTIFAGFQSALHLINEIGVQNIKHRIQHLMDYLIQQSVNAGLPILSNIHTGKIFNILQFGPYADLDAVLAKLSQQGVYATRRGDGIRLALHFYNSEQDIDRFVRAMT